ncbi:MAG: porin [Bermanella sp.]
MAMVGKGAIQTIGLYLLVAALPAEAFAFKDNQSDEKNKLSNSLLSSSGSVMLDYDQYGDFYSKKESGSQEHFEVRRAKLGFKTNSSGPFKGELEFSYNNEYQGEEELELGDAYVKYQSSVIDISLGQMKEPFGLERQTGSSKTTSIERSMVTSAFSPGRSLGLMLKKSKKRYTLALGVFQEEDKTNSPQAITARFTRAFEYARQHQHLGMSLTHRELKDQEFQIKERGEINSGDNIIRSAKFDANSQRVLQIESAWFSEKMRLQMEASIASIEQTEGDDWLYSGFYLQASYFLKGGAYQYKKGIIKNKVHKGAWELVSRYSGLNLRDNEIGSEAAIIMLGVNYYAHKKLRLMANILIPDISGNTVNEDQTGNGVSLRAQYSF